MYLNHFGLNEPPFRITPDVDFFFQGANRGATLEALLYAVTHDEGIVKVSGEVGSGKTMLCRVLIERLPKGVETVFLANPSLSRDEILLAIADELAFDLGELRAARLLRALQERLIKLFADGRRVVVLIDEAHAMPKQTLEEIRLLSNLESGQHKLLQIVLFGQPELDEHLNSADMRQLKERVTHSFRLEPLRRSDVESYVEFRMRAAGYRGPSVFTRPALKLIADVSEGLTRRINILSDKALLAAFAGGSHGVTEREARRAAADCEFYRPARKLGKSAALAGALSAALVLGWGLRAWLPTDIASARAGATPAPPGAQPAAPPQPRSLVLPAIDVRAGVSAQPTPVATPAVPAADRSAPEPAPPILTAAAGQVKLAMTAPVLTPTAGEILPAPTHAGELTRERFEIGRA